MKFTIFYSWQSDSPHETNRNFIEGCLKKAIKLLSSNLIIKNADRPELKIDKDTKGVPGSPPIVETIFNKIDECLIFVADVTFVGKRDDGARPMPNTNVAVEYGYATKSLGHGRISRPNPS